MVEARREKGPLDLSVREEIQELLAYGEGIPIYDQSEEQVGELQRTVGIALFTENPLRIVAILETGDMFVLMPNAFRVPGSRDFITTEDSSLRIRTNQDPDLRGAFLRSLNWGRVVADNTVPHQAEGVNAAISSSINGIITAKSHSVHSFKAAVAGLKT